MRILLDECVPKRFGRELAGHVVRTAPQEGWSGKKNGELLRLLIDAGFEVFLTVDQGVGHQQNLQTALVAIIVMIAPTNRLVHLIPLAPQVLAALKTAKPGEIIEIRA